MSPLTHVPLLTICNFSCESKMTLLIFNVGSSVVETWIVLLAHFWKKKTANRSHFVLVTVCVTRVQSVSSLIPTRVTRLSSVYGSVKAEQGATAVFVRLCSSEPQNVSAFTRVDKRVFPALTVCSVTLLRQHTHRYFHRELWVSFPKPDVCLRTRTDLLQGAEGHPDSREVQNRRCRLTASLSNELHCRSKLFKSFLMWYVTWETCYTNTNPWFFCEW